MPRYSLGVLVALDTVFKQVLVAGTLNRQPGSLLKTVSFWKCGFLR